MLSSNDEEKVNRPVIGIVENIAARHGVGGNTTNVKQSDDGSAPPMEVTNWGFELNSAEVEQLSSFPRVPAIPKTYSEGSESTTMSTKSVKTRCVGKVRTLLLSMDCQWSQLQGPARRKRTKKMTPKMVEKVDEKMRLLILQEVRLGTITIDEAMKVIQTGHFIPRLRHLSEGDLLDLDEDEEDLIIESDQSKRQSALQSPSLSTEQLAEAHSSIARSGQWCEAEARLEHHSLVLTRPGGASYTLMFTPEIEFVTIADVPMSGLSSVQIVKKDTVVGYFCSDSKSKTEKWFSLLQSSRSFNVSKSEVDVESNFGDAERRQISQPQEQETHQQEDETTQATEQETKQETNQAQQEPESDQEPTVFEKGDTAVEPIDDQRSTPTVNSYCLRRSVSPQKETPVEVDSTTNAIETIQVEEAVERDQPEEEEPSRPMSTSDDNEVMKADDMMMKADDSEDETPPPVMPRPSLQIEQSDLLTNMTVDCDTNESEVKVEDNDSTDKMTSALQDMSMSEASLLQAAVSKVNTDGTVARRQYKNRETLLRNRQSNLYPEGQAVVDTVIGCRDLTSQSIHQIIDESTPVQNDCDERVGDMEYDVDDSSTACAYLKEEMDKMEANMKDKFGGGTNAGYSTAYQNAKPVGLDQAADASKRPNNKLKNRYGNIVAYDNSRVVLDVINDDPDTDYVNANWIDGYQKPKAYIASQGPVPNSFISFWRMIWYCNIETIVMVTHEVENGRMKCHRYWPDPTSTPPSKEMEYGSVRVVHVMTQEHAHFYCRVFDVMYKGEKRTIKQFAYLSWPDHGVPMTSPEILGFRNAVRNSRSSFDSPLLVHCSAGVGRTGTYIAIDRLLEQCVQMQPGLDIDQILHNMRMSRNFMIQTEIQYVFVHRAIYDAICELYAEETEKARAQAKARSQAQLALQLEQNRLQAEDAHQKALIEKNRLEQEQAEMEAQKAAEIAEQRAQDEMRAIEEARLAYEAEVEAARLAKLKARKREQDLVNMATTEHTANAAKAIIRVSIAERMKLLDQAGTTWLVNYRKSLDEWNERNKFDAEDYDVGSTLTPIESRMTALKEHSQ